MSAWLDALTPGGYGDAVASLAPVPSGAPWMDTLLGTMSRAANRWIDVETFQRTGGMGVTDQGARLVTEPAVRPSVLPGLAGGAGGLSQYLPLILGGAVVLVILSKVGK